ncbi:hypothetical protein E4P41_09725 [Geodermatophilus sp. DF01-2]|uniref:hypothetical protein n=1 Tax=Geodermatophilus sp. DF01-2 TaxID=2559610 RepID=UPI001073D2C0|nr:hypothetical protein [Geodermatophilus sp. DF01_2]TFV61289.1 hypothetical protein E4P41_09725 [Geodermatophilus sp. DF01_2]
MASSSSRSRAATRRSPRAAPRLPAAPQPPAGRPVLVPFAAAFGVLVAAEDLYLGYLLRGPEPGWRWFLLAPLLLAVWAVVGAATVWLGRARGWLVLATASVLPLLALLALAGLFGVLGDGRAAGWALLLLAGPVGCLVLAVRRPVREWTRPGRATRPPDQNRRTVRTR